MKYTLKYLFFISVVMLVSCEEDKLGPSVFDTSDTALINEVDRYIDSVYTSPYNVEIIYRWKESETDMSYNLVPSYLSKVQPLMHVIDTTYVQPYNKIGGNDFLKVNIPKQFLLIGSPGINASNGTEVLGTAEGGVKILLYKTNQFDRSKPETYEDILHTIHHEFAHILHQKKQYDETFKKITPNDYTSTWYNVTDSTANNKGFITTYAMASIDEDFAEMTGIMLLNSNQSWNEMINKMKGKDLIKSKEQYIVTYFKTKWKIDFYVLQKEVSDRIAGLKPSSVTLFGLRSSTSPAKCACHYYPNYPAKKNETSENPGSHPILTGNEE